MCGEYTASEKSRAICNGLGVGKDSLEEAGASCRNLMF